MIDWLYSVKYYKWEVEFNRSNVVGMGSNIEVVGFEDEIIFGQLIKDDQRDALYIIDKILSCSWDFCAWCIGINWGQKLVDFIFNS